MKTNALELLHIILTQSAILKKNVVTYRWEYMSGIVLT